MGKQRVRSCQAAAGPGGGWMQVCGGGTGCKEPRSRQCRGTSPPPPYTATTDLDLIGVAGQRFGGGGSI